jgi:hypothetical protein
MGFLDIHSWSAAFNSAFDKIAVIVFWVGLVLMTVRYIRKSIATEKDVGKNLYFGILVFLEAALLAFIIYSPLPQLLVALSRQTLDLATIRWVILYLIAIIWSYSVSYKQSGWRGIVFVMLILTTFLFGWLYDRWLGMFAVSVPVLLVYVNVINKVAQVILPASNPEDKLEARIKTRIFFAYLLGLQYPIWIAKAKTGQEFDKQLDGNFTNKIGKTGIIWTWSHQVAGISKGIGFTRVAGPGLIFTDPFESPIALVDLRMQSRISVVNTVTKDGMEVPAVVFTAFAIDKRNSSTTQSRRSKADNEGNFTIDHKDESFAYSTGRVSAVLSTAGIYNPRPNEKQQEFFWDEWVVDQVEHATRLVVAERSLDELWRPQNDDLGVSALNEIAARLQSLLSPELAEVGINLITVRIVNYQFTPEDDIVKQNIATWSSYWEQRITEAKSDIETIYREEIEKAHAFSKSILLSSITDSITKARRINNDLPRHMIAQYYVHALEEYIKGQPGLNVSESKKQLETMKDFLMTNRTEGSE